MQRYFVNIKDDKFILSKEQIHQILHVMHTRIGEELEFLNNGMIYGVSLSKISPIDFKLSYSKKADTELSYDITLLYCHPKGSKLEFIVQKATELGVKKIVIFESSRTVVKVKEDNLDKKKERLIKIATEASEQCGRAIIPSIIYVEEFKNINLYKSALNFIAYENEKGNLLGKDLPKSKASCSILLGAEGGFSKEEVEYAEQNGFTSISLGKRILRSETAVIYALSLLSNFLEEN